MRDSWVVLPPRYPCRSVLQPDGQNALVLTKDHLFKAPSNGGIALISAAVTGQIDGRGLVPEAEAA